MTELEGQKAELNNKLNSQLSTMAAQIKNKGQTTERPFFKKNEFYYEEFIFSKKTC